ncbi:MAG: hypothetical protein ACYDH6_09735 [Acidimicrobiales bacterium]
MRVEVDADGAAATRRALEGADDERTAVWVGAADDAALDEFRDEIGRAR